MLQDNVLADFVSFEGRWLDENSLQLDTGVFQLAGRDHRVIQIYRRAAEASRDG